MGLTPLLGLLDTSFLKHEEENGPGLIVVIVVNARVDSANDYGKRGTPISLIDTFFTTIGTAIDSTSFLLIDQLGHMKELLQKSAPNLEMFIVNVSLDSINNDKDDEFWRWFQNIDTSWSLDNEEKVRALIEVGSALVFDSKDYKNLMNELHYKRDDYARDKKVSEVSKVCSKLNDPTSIAGSPLNPSPKGRAEYATPSTSVTSVSGTFVTFDASLNTLQATVWRLRR